MIPQNTKTGGILRVFFFCVWGVSRLIKTTGESWTHTHRALGGGGVCAVESPGKGETSCGESWDP